jgi:hypothetical protein
VLEHVIEKSEQAAYQRGHKQEKYHAHPPETFYKQGDTLNLIR